MIVGSRVQDKHNFKHGTIVYYSLLSPRSMTVKWDDGETSEVELDDIEFVTCDSGGVVIENKR